MVLSKHELLKLALHTKPKKEVLEKKSKSELIEYLFGIQTNKCSRKRIRESQKTFDKCHNKFKDSDYEFLKEFYNKFTYEKEIKKSDFFQDSVEKEKKDFLKFFFDVEEKIKNFNNFQIPVLQLQQEQIKKDIEKWNETDKKIIENTLEKIKEIEDLLLNVDFVKIKEINNKFSQYEIQNIKTIIDNINEKISNNYSEIEEIRKQYNILTKVLGPLEILQDQVFEIQEKFQLITQTNDAIKNYEKDIDEIKNKIINLDTNNSLINVSLQSNTANINEIKTELEKEFENFTREISDLRSVLSEYETNYIFNWSKQYQELYDEFNRQLTEIKSRNLDQEVATVFNFSKELDLFREEVNREFENIRITRPFELTRIDADVNQQNLDLQELSTRVAALQKAFSDSNRQQYEELYNEFYKKYLEFIRKISERNRNYINETIKNSLQNINQQIPQVTFGNENLAQLQNLVTELQTRLENLATAQQDVDVSSQNEIALQARFSIDDLFRKINVLETNIITLSRIRQDIASVLQQIERASLSLTSIEQKNNEARALKNRTEEMTNQLNIVIGRFQTLAIEFFPTSQILELRNNYDELQTNFEELQQNLAIIERDKIPISSIETLVQNLNYNIAEFRSAIENYRLNVNFLRNLDQQYVLLNNELLILQSQFQNAAENIDQSLIDSFRQRLQDAEMNINSVRLEILNLPAISNESRQLAIENINYETELQNIIRENQNLNIRLREQTEVFQNQIDKNNSILEQNEKLFKSRISQFLVEQSTIVETFKQNLQSQVNQQISDLQREKQNFEQYKTQIETLYNERLNELRILEANQRAAFENITRQQELPVIGTSDTEIIKLELQELRLTINKILEEERKLKARKNVTRSVTRSLSQIRNRKSTLQRRLTKIKNSLKGRGQKRAAEESVKDLEKLLRDES